MSNRLSIQRTSNYFFQVRNSLIYKFLTITVSFASIPLMIKYLGNELYGIWSTLLSIMSWISIFDIGIGNGLRNKISEALVKDDKKDLQKNISTAYVMLGAISLSLLVLFFIVSSFISWQDVFNTTALSNSELKDFVNITAAFLFINFWLSLINQVFNGLQKASLVAFNQFLANTLALMCVVLLYSYFKSSLFKLAFAYGLSLVMSSAMLSVWFYTNNTELIPKFQNYSKKYVHSITSLGFKFFIIQIAYIVIFTTDKILIIQLFSPEYVTSYDVVFKLFSIITIAHSLLMGPLWSAYSDAYHRDDMEWIKKTIKIQLKIYILFVIGTITLSFLAKLIIALWIGKKLSVDNMLIIAMVLFILVSIWNNIFAFFINATNKLNVQLNTSAVAMIINIPLSIIFVRFFKMKVYGIVLATCISLSLFAIFGSIQTFKILKGKEDEKQISKYSNTSI